MKTTTTVLALGGALLLGAIVTDAGDVRSMLSGDDPVSVNARRAVEACGEGRVAAVSVRSYACKGADQAVIDEVMGRGGDEER